MIVNTLCYAFCMVITPIVIPSLAINSSPIHQASYQFGTPRFITGPRDSEFQSGDRLNVTQLLLNRFYYLFQEQPSSPSAGTVATAAAPTTTTTNVQPVLVDQDELVRIVLKLKNDSFNYDDQQQSLLETRKIEQQVEGESSRRNYFKVLNRVFSRVELPQVYKSAQFKGGHCGLHIGCVEEIPNFPSLLKKANVSSSFTVYTPDNSKQGHKILYEPIVHHQLQDTATIESELEEKLRNHLQWNYPPGSNGNGAGTKPVNPANNPNQKRQQVLAPSWRSAVRISHTQEYPFDLAALEQSGFNASLNTRIIVGGYFAKEDEEWIDEVVRQWQLLEPCNIIKVSWADSNRGLYHTAAYNSRIVGRQLTLFLHYMDQMFHLDLNRFHLVGHSLGAHIAGFVGADNDGRIARITGLDPAGPIFVELNASMRLDPSDAIFVDVVHTNGGTITKGALGLSIPSGHVDYYCNGGSVQPGCYFSSVTRSIMDPVERVACSHRRSYRYFIEVTKLAISELAGANTDLSMETRQDFDTGNNALYRNSTTSSVEPDPQPAKSHLPRAFLFEAKQDDLDKLTQPEIVLMSGSSMRRASFTEMAPLKRRLEFHLLKPDFPAGKRGLYFFKTRSESPFFATKQYALTIKTDAVIRRKIALMAKIDQTLVAEAELDEIPGVLTLPFAPNDPRVLNISDSSRVPQLSLMWKHRSFNLLLNQQNELHLSGLELSLLDSDDGHQVIRYSTIQSRGLSAVASSASLLKSVFSGGDLALARNQWYKFEGRLDKSNQRSI